MCKGPFKYYVIKEMAGWSQKMAFFESKKESQKHDDVILEWSLKDAAN